MAILGGIDIHRSQLTYDYVDTETGEIRAGEVRPACRQGLRRWLERFEGAERVAFAIEAGTGWRYVSEELRRAGCKVYLAEPGETAYLKGPKRRAKRDLGDAKHLRELVQQGRVPESWIPPAEILEARALIRLYLDLLEERGAWVERVNAALFHQGVPATSLMTKVGRTKLSEAELTPQGRRQVDVGTRQVKRLDQERDIIAGLIEVAAKAQPACRKLVEELYGVGWLLAYALWAELGDVRRFSSSRDVVRYTGMDVTVYSSGDHRSMGSLSRQGSPVLRWALYEVAVQAAHKRSPDYKYYRQVKTRRQNDSGIAFQSIMRRVARRAYHLMRVLPAEAWPAAA